MKKLKQIYVKRIFTLVVFCVLILALFVIGKQPAGYRRELENRDKALRDSITHFKAIREDLRKEALRQEKRADSLLVRIAEVEKREKTLIDRYEAKLRKRRTPVHLADSVLYGKIAEYR